MQMIITGELLYIIQNACNAHELLQGPPSANDDSRVQSIYFCFRQTKYIGTSSAYSMYSLNRSQSCTKIYSLPLLYCMTIDLILIVKNRLLFAQNHASVRGHKQYRINSVRSHRDQLLRNMHLCTTVWLLFNAQTNNKLVGCFI